MTTNLARICVPVCVRRASELAASIKSAAQFADVIELRLDYLADNERGQALAFLRENLKHASSPILITFRAPEQGGQNTANPEARRSFWTSLISILGSPFLDLELDLVLSFAAERSLEESPIDWSRVICSHHDFGGVALNLEQIYERMAATPARILKVAIQAQDATDCLPIFRLLERAQREGRELIAIAMGQAGVMTRILGPSCGSFLTYGSIDDESATAPGQLTARELREVYRLDKIDRETEVIGLIGNPVGHSLSPHIHNAALGTAGVNAVYIPFEVRDAGEFMRRMAHPGSRELGWNLRGLSVTAPHKSAVMNSLDWIDSAAQEIGAVNTIVIRGTELHGHNTDADGFITPLKRKFGSLGKARCAIVGAGGGARAALWALRREGADVALFVRDPDKARLASKELGVDSYLVSTASFAGFDIVVNATPLGTRGVREQDTTAVARQLRGVRLAYDLVYNPLETRFMREASAAGCETLGGIEMLLAQAAEQFKLWIAEEPDDEVMRAAALKALR
ncbi:MAG: 3-dehydroquinate dehydratase / shikimate dehydrogenase [Blastocatellia bacterium]|jgi:3-dehydroquinate dehydratase/shikimate dehydrogenase|nr:3-dehydroquinate dehydratase / shikimate dehydrogenase [Blastocatellia bacterium]